MIRTFHLDSPGILNITSDSNVPLYNLLSNQFVLASRSLAAHSSWQFADYAYDEDNNYKYFAVDGSEWVKFDSNELNITRDFNSLDGDYTVTIDRDFDFLNGSLSIWPVSIWSSQIDFNNIPTTSYQDGTAFITTGGIEIGPQIPTYTSSIDYYAWRTGYKVDPEEYYDDHGVFANSKLTISSGSIPNENVTSINKIIKIDSVAPDYFDKDGNSISGIDYNLGHQIQSDGIYNSNKRTGFKIGDNQYVNIGDATATPLMYGGFYPSRKGVN
ncbi:hypothetical protein [Companilactobacillus ginsenosidimutans]|uniref:Surface layer protein A domain-containing protein n=1 Tax=Companilactobacillus ginsenosidimutans TaxID=1007676 RepID=A0A0H4QLW6_9LACO|nr:hypothetical protein [Companilactobacillus ginsenosidimutans]AKP67698.1 hypothetical protein ABM34_09270 [Companilactobacillus ginsenosidimutans]